MVTHYSAKLIMFECGKAQLILPLSICSCIELELGFDNKCSGVIGPSSLYPVFLNHTNFLLQFFLTNIFFSIQNFLWTKNFSILIFFNTLLIKIWWDQKYLHQKCLKTIFFGFKFIFSKFFVDPRFFDKIFLMKFFGSWYF